MISDDSTSSGAQNPPPSQVVPPRKTGTTAATPAVESAFEISPARQSYSGLVWGYDFGTLSRKGRGP